MNRSELIAELLSLGLPEETGRLSLRLIFRFLEDHVYELRLKSGEPLNDATDFKELFREVTEALGAHLETRSIPAQPQTLRQEQPRNWNEICSRCGHEHEGSAECGVQLGGGRTCRCEMELRA